MSLSLYTDQFLYHKFQDLEKFMVILSRRSRFIPYIVTFNFLRKKKSLMFFYSYILSFLPQKIKFANLPFLTILEKWTFTTIFLENLKCRKPVNFIPIFKKNS